MSVLIRGAKNTVRNPVRTAAVVGLLGVATAFALSLLLANEAVKYKIEDLKTNGATTLAIRPEGSASGPDIIGGGEPLTDDMLAQVSEIEHVIETGATLNLTQARAEFRAAAPSAGGAPSTTNFTLPESQIDLESPVEAGTLGRRGFSGRGGNSNITEIPDFKIPVQATGVSGNLDANGDNYVLTAGEFFSTEDGYQAVVGMDLATKNNLSVGSTFTGYDQTFTVVGIYDAGSTFANAGLLIPLKTAQTLSDQAGEVSSIVVRIVSIDNMDAAEEAINAVLGEDRIDITSSAQNTEAAINSLKSIQKISIAGVIIATIAAGTIVFMIMIIIVRERKREIAVLKAIGGSNIKITGQFVTEAVILTLLSVVVGASIALASSNSITKLLVTTNSSEADSSDVLQGPDGPGGGQFRMMVGGPGAEEQTTTKDLLKDVSTSAGPLFIAEAFGTVILIAILGSAIPAFAISKVRPAEVLRSE
jgi:putative ABC transport system permease protein